MAGKTRITEHSKLLPLADAIEATNNVEGLVPSKEMREILRRWYCLIPALIRKDLAHMDWLHENGIVEGMSDLAFSACHGVGRLSAVENGEPYATDEDAIAWLRESGSRAETLAALARMFEVEPPRIVKQALALMESESQAA